MFSAVEAMELLGIPKARVITVQGLSKVVRDEEIVNQLLEEERRLQDDD